MSNTQTPITEEQVAAFLEEKIERFSAEFPRDFPIINYHPSLKWSASGNVPPTYAWVHVYGRTIQQAKENYAIERTKILSENV